MNMSSYFRLSSRFALRCCWLLMLIATQLSLSCSRGVKPAAADSLAAAEQLIAAHPDSVQAYETLLRITLRQAEAENDWNVGANAALLLASQLQWTNENEALSLALKARKMIGRCDSDSSDLTSRTDLMLAGLYEQMGDVARARTLYNQCLKDSASRLTALAHLADMSIADGDPEAALDLALQMQQSGALADDMEAQFILANCYMQSDSLVKARKIYERLVASAGDKTRYAALRHLAEIAVMENRTTELPAILDSAFASAEAVFFGALKQKDDYFRATLEQERHAERLAYRGRMMKWALIGVTILGAMAVLFLVSLNRHRRAIHEQRLQQETREREREAREAEERLRQQEQKIQLLQRYILEKSELLQRLRAEGDRKRLLSQKDWADMEKLLDSITDGFVAALRQQHPEFREDDIQLCMLTRMKLSNQVISDIYLITVSAVKHRKLKLKKEGFGVTDPDTPLDEVLAKI